MFSLSIEIGQNSLNFFGFIQTNKIRVVVCIVIFPQTYKLDRRPSFSLNYFFNGNLCYSLKGELIGTNFACSNSVLL